MEGLPQWRLTGFYGFPDNARRRASWDLLRYLRGLHNIPRCVVGDFNDIMASNEKIGGVPQLRSRMIGFSAAVQDYNLHDIRMVGYQYTWQRSRGTTNWIAERLDRALVTETWREILSDAWVENILVVHSDHSALVVNCRTTQIHRCRPFQFENVWRRNNECRLIVAE